MWHLDENGIPMPNDFDPREVVWTHDVSRRKEYPELKEQLDLLWHSIDQGYFGEEAKNSPFYTNIKTIKDKYEKGTTRQPYKE